MVWLCVNFTPAPLFFGFRTYLKFVFITVASGIRFRAPLPYSRAPLSLVLAVAEKATLGARGALIVNAPRGVSPTIMTALRGFHYGRLFPLDAPACITSRGVNVAFVLLPPATFAPR